MKATRQEPQTPPFVPVVITLETQEEVDKLFALLDNKHISRVLNLGESWTHLVPFVSAKGERNPFYYAIHCLTK